MNCKRKTDGLERFYLKGIVSMLCEHILKMTPRFKEHSYIKRQQAQRYNQDRIDCMSSDCYVALLQVILKKIIPVFRRMESNRFAAQPQVSLFTVSLWFHQKQYTIAISSDNHHHNKDT